ncbi:hypothetical protein [Georgenia sp. H159]|uniref:hypothetical protein n=1 Tax=Georgenia sp. H159 TaxID=3076115 RepID=UPI002D797D0F|nr:hypothetical protein [Georgenia sp. H159]
MSQILAGPRGRRLCLELALAMADDDGGGSALRSAVFDASHHLDPGGSRALFGWSVPDPLPQPAPADVARLVDALPLGEPDERAVLHALAAAVDSARYWQEPDGEDVLAGTPEVSAALERVAAHVLASAAASWWAASLRHDDQWVVTFDTGAQRSGGTAAEVLGRWVERTREDEAAARRDTPRDPRAPYSGTWWSRPLGLAQTTGSVGTAGPAGLWLVEDAFGWERAVVRRVAVPTDARVHEIDGLDAWIELCRRHPLDVTASRRHDWFRTTGQDHEWVVPDWSRVAEDVDAVHLTLAGYLAAAGRAGHLGDGRWTVLAGWDPDATVWLTDLPGSGGREETWLRDHDGDWSAAS